MGREAAGRSERFGCVGKAARQRNAGDGCDVAGDREDVAEIQLHRIARFSPSPNAAVGEVGQAMTSHF